jgi:hypothetical protein
MKGKPVRCIVVFFYGAFPIWFGIGISLKFATKRSGRHWIGGEKGEGGCYMAPI